MRWREAETGVFGVQTVQQAQLVAGAARVDCDCSPGLELSGFAAREQLSTGTHDQIGARALVVADAGGSRTALVAVDVVGLDLADLRAWRSEIANRTQIPAEAIIIAATHTHSAPAAMPGRAAMGRVDSAFWRSLGEAIISAVVEADRRCVPATLRLGFGTEHTVARNRRIPDGPIDPLVPVIRVDTADKPIAVLLSYACHPVTLGPGNLEVTGDYPAFARSAVETVFDQALGIFLTGCAGQLNTGHLERSFAEAQRLGQAVGGAAIQTAAQIALPAGAAVAQAPDETGRRQVAWHTEQVALPRLPVNEQPAQIEELEITALRWGSMIIIGLPGEPFMELGQQIRADSPVPGVVVIGYANGSPGYIPHSSAYPAGGYEVCEAHLYYGETSAFAPEAADLMIAAALRAIAEVNTSP